MDIPDLSKLGGGKIPPPAKPSEDAAPMIRVLYCHDEGSLDMLPIYDGPPEYDDALQVLIDRKHTTPSGTPHKGQLFLCPEAAWADRETRKQIVDQFHRGGSKGLAEADSEIYNSRDTFSEDAHKCYVQHLRPTGGCPDYRANNKLLVPDTKAERKEAGLAAPSKAPGVRIAICQFCPVESFYARKRRGE